MAWCPQTFETLAFSSLSGFYVDRLSKFLQVTISFPKPIRYSPAINANDSKQEFFIPNCPMNEMVWKQVKVKTRPRLQTKYNILLASLAGVDLLVGIANKEWVPFA